MSDPSVGSSIKRRRCRCRPEFSTLAASQRRSVAASLKRRQISDKFPVVKSLERFRGVIGAATVVRQQLPSDLLMLFSAKKIGRIIELSHGC